MSFFQEFNTIMKRKPRLIILGEPYDIRNKLAQKMSNFFGVPVFTASDLIDKEYNSNEFQFKLSLINACNDGFILSGIPTSKKHTLCLDNVDLCLYFVTDEKKAISYNTKRRWCETCFRTYHLEDKPPLHEDKCDRCGSTLGTLPTDDPNQIKAAIYEWNKIFHPVTSHYRDFKKLCEIREEKKDINKIASKILKILDKEIDPVIDIDISTTNFLI